MDWTCGILTVQGSEMVNSLFKALHNQFCNPWVVQFITQSITHGVVFTPTARSRLRREAGGPTKPPAAEAGEMQGAQFV